jgi:hypothetical protein
MTSSPGLAGREINRNCGQIMNAALQTWARAGFSRGPAALMISDRPKYALDLRGMTAGVRGKRGGGGSAGNGLAVRPRRGQSRHRDPRRAAPRAPSNARRSRSGSVSNIDDIKRALRSEGYPANYLSIGLVG